MSDWRDLLLSGVSSLGSFGLVVGLALLVALRVLMPAAERRSLRVPVVLLIVHVVARGARVFAGDGSLLGKSLAVTALFCLLAAIGRLGFQLVVDWFLGQRLGRPLPRIFREIIQVCVFIGVALVTLRALGVEPGSLLTTSALLTAVLGLSMQDTLGNLFAGLAVQTERPFAVGDFIQFQEGGELIGKVTEINWRATKIVTNDLVEVIVPNGTLAKAPLKNFSRPTPVTRRIVRVQAQYEAPPGRVRRAIAEAVHGSQGVLTSPAPRILINAFADSGVEYVAQFYITDFENRLLVESEVRQRIWYALQRAGISIPFPIRDVRFRDMATEQKERPTDVESRLRTLRGAEFFDALPAATLEQLAEVVAERTYEAGELIVRQGDTGTELFVVSCGEVAVLVEREGEAPHQLARLGPGRVFGEVAAMTGERRMATIEALRNTSLLVVGQGDFQSVTQDSPELAARISQVLTER